MATETKTAVVKLKLSNLASSLKGKLDSSANTKKIESSGKQVVNSLRPKLVSTVVKSEVKSKTTSGSSKAATTATANTTKVKQKKVYTLPGQKFDPPEEKALLESKSSSDSLSKHFLKQFLDLGSQKQLLGSPPKQAKKRVINSSAYVVSYLQREPLRIFYESLSKQLPTSEMAEFWMMEHGMLSSERAKKAYERKQRKQKQLRTGTPIKSLKPLSKPGSLQKQQASNNGDVKGKKKILDDSDDDFILSSKRRKA